MASGSGATVNQAFISTFLTSIYLDTYINLYAWFTVAPDPLAIDFIPY